MVYVDLVGPTVGVPTYGPEDDSTEYEQEFNHRLRESEGLNQQWSDDARLYYRTYAGNPWVQDDKEWMEDTERPVATFNYTMSAVNTLVGHQLTNRREVQFKGVGEFEDHQVAEWYTNLVRTHWAQGDGHRTEAISYQDMLITGRGFAHIYIDETQVPFKLRIEPVSPLEMYIDPWALEQNLVDAKFFIRAKRWRLEDAIASFPEAEEELKSLYKPIGRRLFPKIMDMSRQGRFRQVAPWTAEDTITLYEYQYKKLEPHVYFRVPFRVDPQTGQNVPFEDIPKVETKLQSGQRVYVTQKEWKRIRRAFNEDPLISGEIQTAHFAKDCYYRCMMAGRSGDRNIIIEEPVKLKTDMFTYIAVTGYVQRKAEEGRIEHFGLVSQCYQPQLWSSRILSGAIEMLSRGSKGGGFAEADAFEDPEEFLDQSAVPGAWHMTRPGALQNGKIQERSAAAYPQGMEMMFRLANTAIPQVTGISEWISGNSTRERSDKLISNLQNQSMAQLAPIIDPMDQFRTEMGRLLARLTYLYILEEDINRALGQQTVEGMTFQKVPNPQTGQEEEQPIPYMDPYLGIQRAKTPADWMKEKDPLNFDVVVDLGTATTNEKSQMWEFMSRGVLQTFVEARLPVDIFFAELVRNTPGLPASKAEELAKKIEAEQDMTEQQRAMETLQQMSPEEKAEIAQQLMTEVQSLQQQAPQQGPPQAGPPSPGGGGPVQ